MSILKRLTFLLFAIVGMAFASCCDTDDDYVPSAPPTVTNPDKEQTGGDDNTTTEAPGQTEKVVDLGFSVKWATCNLGAETPSQSGDFYSWGETATKGSHSEANYFDKSYTQFGINGKKKISGTNRDAALAKLGEGWRMPTQAEMQELVNGCTWQEETLGGVRGVRGTAANGNSIFLPMAGIFANSIVEVGNLGYYWCGEIGASTTVASHAAALFILGGDYVRATSYYRWEGMTVRPVYVGD